jgi:hypothetical protein
MIVALIVVGLLSGYVILVSVKGEMGTLQFTANGEDIVRQGLTTKDGWQITFDHVYVTLGGIAAHQTNPPFDAEMGGQITAGVTSALDGVHTIDLAEGGEDAEPIPLGEVEALLGFYNALSFKMVRASEGPADGYSLVAAGTAEKDGNLVDFAVRIHDERAYTCGEYIGDVRKGILQGEAGTTDLEMTFHFDHIFGDAEIPMDDGLNIEALGFDPLAALARDGLLDVDLEQLKCALSVEDYQILLDALPTLGHVGEGHCHCETWSE